jgi:hypothetical protein
MKLTILLTILLTTTPINRVARERIESEAGPRIAAIWRTSANRIEWPVVGFASAHLRHIDQLTAAWEP